MKLEHSRVLDDTVIERLREELGLFKEQVFFSETPLESSYLFQIQDVLREGGSFFMSGEARSLRQISAKMFR